ncbi:MAG: insulinase family protein [Gammaproteobacteria bacterium]|nr:insulinase family protein [Gammaproteobacteria bacterium]NNJ84918.1 peptidase M16 [Gammaproteobacteria bacterium]
MVNSYQNAAVNHDMKTNTRLIFILLFIVSLVLPLPARCDTAIVTSPHDTREYAAFELPNRLKVLVISDPRTDKAAAALDVFVGSNAEPDDRPGLAHFLEHMLFLGTRKYPAPDAFQTFITKHAGKQNAYTGAEHTNYFFDVDKDHLPEALDRFGQFFIAPAFAEAYVHRERSAVDAEFHSKRKDDGWREMAITRQMMNPRHPFSRFRVGNLATLSDGEGGNVREDLVAFYRRYYSANLMGLVVLGKEPVEVLMQWVRDVFSAVPDLGAAPPRVTAPMFTPDRLPVRTIAKPVKERRKLKLSFPVPPLTRHYKTKPLYYIAHIIGHEGKGSLLSVLKQRGWAEALNAGVAHNHRDSALFSVSIGLTEKGMENRDAIIGLVFRSIALIEARGVREWLFRELSQLANIDFLFQERLPPIDYVSTLADLIHEYPTPDILRGSSSLEDYDEALIREYLSMLTPDNVLIMVTDPDANPDAAPDTPAESSPSWSRTPWFEAPYRVAAIEPALIEQWRTGGATGQTAPCAMNTVIDHRQAHTAPPRRDNQSTTPPCPALPAPNPFVPQDLSLKSIGNPEHKPVRIVDTPGLEIWFQQDATYRMPRADFYVSIRSPVANDTPTHSVLTDLLIAQVKDLLTEFTYPADLAGLEYEIYSHLRGISIRIEGYHDKQALLLARVLDVLGQPNLDEKRFRIAKEKLTRKLRNKRKQVPYRRTIAELYDLLLKPRWTPDARLAALAPVALSDLRAFVPKLFERLSLVALSHGNVHKTDALAMGELLKARLLRGVQPVRVPRGQVIQLTQDTSYLRRITPYHHDTAVAVYFQGQNRGFRELAEMALLGQLMKSAFFNALRTEQQLGYVVLASAYPLLEVPGLMFLVQSPHTDPGTLTAHVERFLTDFTKVLGAMEPTEFDRHKTALVAEILEHEESLSVRSDRYWREIDQGYGSFDSRQRKAEAVRAITLDDIGRVYRAQITGEQQRRLIVHAAGNRQGDNSDKGAAGRDTRIVRDAGPRAAFGPEIVAESVPEPVDKMVILKAPERFKREQGVVPWRSVR